MAIDGAAPPEWIREHVAPGQLRLQRSLLWIVAIYESPTLGKAEVNVAQRLHIATEGQDKKERRLAHAELARSTKQSQQTNITAVKKLEAEGWLLVERVNNRVNRYLLAWPVEDVLAEEKKQPSLCGEPTKKDMSCTRKAGWGTVHQGVGKCVLHEPKSEDADGEELPVQLQPLELESGEDVKTEQASTPIDETSDSNKWSLQLQPLEHPTPTIGALYVGTVGTQLQVRENSRLLAVGEPEVRTARGTVKAPSAQPEISLNSRRLVRGMARYRDAPGWAKRHLAVLADAALADGLTPDVINRYAVMVAGEARFADHQHIPEFREVLRRAARDRALGDVCPACGHPECRCATATATVDRPWTDQDQADLERAAAHLGATLDDLAHTGTEN